MIHNFDEVPEDNDADLSRVEKSRNRYDRNLPWDRIVASSHEAERHMRGLKYITDMCAALAVLCEKQEVELEAFRASGAASMETHTTEET